MAVPSQQTLILALTVFLAANAAGAATDFSNMPVGCSWTVKYSNGNTWRETFKGRKGGKYITRTVDLGRKNALVNTKTFDAAGNLVERKWGDGKWERFTPYSCFDTVGSCTYTFSNADGAKSTIVNETRKVGKGFAVRARVKGGEVFPEERFRLGPFGLMQVNQAPNYSASIVSFKGCGLEGS